MKLTKNAEKVLQQRFYAEGENWDMLCRRVANAVAEAEEDQDKKSQWAERYYRLLVSRDFLPNSPTLRNFGRNKGCGSACFVLPIEDSRKSIFKTLADAVDIQAYGGGTGFSFSRLRPKGDPISTTGGKASGPLSFMSIYDYAIGDIIKQGGVRHGANMAVLRVDHPDVEEFIGAKTEEGVLKNFNISVGITDEFMKAVQEDKEWDLKFKGRVYRTLPARKIWGRIIEGAWLNGEPGVVFLDTVNRNNPLSHLGEIEATNPCGEQPLLPYGSCNLGSINLSNMVKGDWIEGKAEVDFVKLKETAVIAVRFLDSVITVNHYPIPEVEKMTKLSRQIGLGVMGFADLCIKLHIGYGSNECIELAGQIMRKIYEHADWASRELGEEKGVPEGVREGRRNGALTSIAPTGT
ncbi:MAG: adenosylcobalamin-dependent ribonucleoside-diphosphate reductase, partial [Deltaproteobacteria bacterium]